MADKLNLQLQIQRQDSPESTGEFHYYSMKDVPVDISFLEMLDILNEDLTKDGIMPISFDSDCREGICGTCGFVINGIAHGPEKKTTVCQLHMRHFKDGDTIIIEPFRANAFPVIKDLVVDRSSFDRIQQAGGFISINTSGNTQDANTIPVPPPKPERGAANDATD